MKIPKAELDNPFHIWEHATVPYLYPLYVSVHIWQNDITLSIYALIG